MEYWMFKNQVQAKALSWNNALSIKKRKQGSVAKGSGQKLHDTCLNLNNDQNILSLDIINVLFYS